MRLLVFWWPRCEVGRIIQGVSRTGRHEVLTEHQLLQTMTDVTNISGVKSTLTQQEQTGMRGGGGGMMEGWGDV